MKFIWYSENQQYYLIRIKCILTSIDTDIVVIIVVVVVVVVEVAAAAVVVIIELLVVAV